MCQAGSFASERLPRRVLRGALIALPMVISGVWEQAWAQDPVGVGESAQQLRATLATMDATFNTLPASAREVLAVDVKLLGQAVDRTLFRIEQAPVPPIDDAVVHDLDFLTDLMVATTGELATIDREGRNALDSELLQRIDNLSDVAAVRLDELDRTTSSWVERTRLDLVEVENDAGTVVLHAVDRTIHATIRSAAVVLLLLGLLLVGLQLLRGGPSRSTATSEVVVGPGRVPGRPPVSPWRRWVALSALSSFFVVSLALAIDPWILSRLAATEEIHPQEHPCQRLVSQRMRFELAQDLDLAALIEAGKDRMTPAARDCLGLPSQEAAVAAVERLVAGSTMERVAGSAADDEWATSAAVPAAGTAAAEPTGIGGAASVPMQAQEDGSRATSSSDVLAELLAALGETGVPAEDATIETRAATPSADDAVPLNLDPEPAAPPIEVAESSTYRVTAGLNYRSAPSLEATRLGIFGPGAQVRVVSVDDGWAEIELGDGRHVFASSDFLEPVP